MSQIALTEPISSAGDNALISAYLEGNEQAFEELVGRYQGRLINYLNTLISDYDMAVDLAQEAFIRVYRNAWRYRGEYRFSTWLYRIATNLAIDEMRRRKRKGRFFVNNVLGWLQPGERTYPLPDLRHAPDRSVEGEEQYRRLRGAVESLPEKYRFAFILREVQELSYDEVGQVLSVSVGTVKSRVHRAKLLLREKLSEVK